jgi:methyl coenzyme M reductase subunit C-like uncharacterized protein (methanogenesis marker protein 7)
VRDVCVTVHCLLRHHGPSADCGVAVFLSRQKVVVKMVCVSRDVFGWCVALLCSHCARWLCRLSSLVSAPVASAIV